MDKYQPDKFVVAKITNKEGKTHCRVFGTWFGGYLNGDEWRLNSGVDWVETKGPLLLFHGSSGSVYEVHKDQYGTSAWTQGILAKWERDYELGVGPKFEVLENQDWTQFDFSGGNKDGQ